MDLKKVDNTLEITTTVERKITVSLDELLANRERFTAEKKKNQENYDRVNNRLTDLIAENETYILEADKLGITMIDNS